MLAAGLVALSASAENIIFFTAVNNTLLELTKETMPVDYGSLIYVPSSIFNSRALGTYSLYSRGAQKVLISDGDKLLYFDMSAGNSYDNEDTTYRYEAIYVNDTAYVPALFVAQYFDIGYSYIRRSERHIVRLTKGSVLSDDDFFSAASSLMEAHMTAFQNSGEAPPTAPPMPPTPTRSPPSPGASPQPSPSAPPETDRSAVTVRLCFLGFGENSAAVLDALDEDSAPACFFVSAEDIYANADLTRRILGSGYGLGLLVREDPAAEYAAFSAALRDTAMCASFLSAAAAPERETRAAAEALGIWFLDLPEPTDSFGYCAIRLEAAEARCDLSLPGGFADTERLLQLLRRDRYTLEAITEVTRVR